MKVDGGLFAGSYEEIPARIAELEALGYDGALSAETSSDPFFPLLLAAEHSERIELITSIAVAFARTPMLLAQVGHDLNRYSRGRFVLGLGSQIRPHITKRFSMPWSHPAARMREFIEAMRAIWACWYDGQKLDFRGEFYTHTLMTPMFTPTDRRFGAPRVFLAAVGPRMTRVAGEVADGLIAHAFTTPRYLREVTLPAIEEGLAASGRSRSDFEISCPVFVVTGKDEKTWEASRTGVSRQIAFYGSTPAYRGVLERHGWGDLQPELNAMSKRGEWEAMGTRITDEMLEEFAIVAQPHEVVSRLRERFEGCLDRVTYAPMGGDRDQTRAALEALRK
ncbi:MAG: LLM class F420-dependent oxidoreductase [Myxococcota bacterium]